MKNLKNRYQDGWSVLSYFIILGILLGIAFGLVNLVLLIGFESLFGINPRGKEAGIAYTAYGIISFGAFLVYAPLIAYYHHQWDGGDKRITKSNNLPDSIK